ncbi:MAG: hypothetical protein EOM87_01340 [Clostridia bacterium]|nr:hypothetical protein [Clostridia bacterium]
MGTKWLFRKKLSFAAGKTTLLLSPLEAESPKRVNFKIIILKEGKLGEYYERVSLIGVDKKDIFIHSATD